MKILVTGKQGQLGHALQELSENQTEITWKFTDRSELDITDSINIKTVVKKFHPDWIINAAAYTDVDGAENNEKIAYKVNADGPHYLAKAAREIGAKLVHVSTDYVFDGTKKEPYTENDEPNPLQVYGKSKLKGEILICETGVSGFIIRTSWVYGHHGKNFVKTILRLAEVKDEIQVIDDQFGSPTYIDDLAKAVMELLLKYTFTKMDLFHFSNKGETSWYLFAKKIIESFNKNCLIISATSSEYRQIARRPSNTVLSKKKIIRMLEIKIKNWDENINLFKNINI